MALLTEDQRVLSRVLSGAATVWTGRPLAGFYIRQGDWPQLLSAVLIVPFFAFWESMALRIPKDNAMGWLFPFFGLGVFVLASWQSYGQVLWNAFARGRTYYALTQDGYAVLYTDAFGGVTKRVYLPAISDVDLQLRSDGSGTIVFGVVENPPWWAGNRGWRPQPPAFDRIANAAAVYDLCAQLQKGKTS
jgi:hypothetical protein